VSRLVVIGASGHGREVASCASAAGIAIAGFVDDNPDLIGQRIGELDILGGTAALRSVECRALLGVGYPEVKLRVLGRALSYVKDWPSLIHPNAVIGDRVRIGRGSFVQAGCVLTVDIDVDEFVTVNVAATINHDCRIGRLATISPGAHIGGNVTIGEGAFVGIGASVMQGVRLGDWSVVGAGATVVKDVPPNAVVIGVPARVSAYRAAGWQTMND